MKILGKKFKAFVLTMTEDQAAIFVLMVAAAIVVLAAV